MIFQLETDLPDWPSVIREKWLLPEAERKGWPPSPQNDWSYAIGVERDLTYLQNLRWSLEEFVLKPNMLSNQTRSLLIRMFKGYYLRDPMEMTFTSFEGGRERFFSLLEYLNQHRDYPWPPVLERVSDGYTILDGSHRSLAALFQAGWFNTPEPDSLVTFEKLPLKYWVAQPNDD